MHHFEMLRNKQISLLDLSSLSALEDKLDLLRETYRLSLLVGMFKLP